MRERLYKRLSPGDPGHGFGSRVGAAIGRYRRGVSESGTERCREPGSRRPDSQDEERRHGGEALVGQSTTIRSARWRMQPRRR